MIRFRAVEIENPHDHSPELVARLRRALLAGADARPDAHRSGFYEIEGGYEVFYVHISPVSGHIVLLATWAVDEAPVPVEAC